MRIGVDLGGSKIEAIALGADGQTLVRQRIATPQGDYRATVGAVAGLVEGIEASLHQRGSVGVGIPGAESLDSGRIKNANSTCLNGQPLRRDLSALLQREVRLANDANCFALSEAIDGAGAGARVVFGAILGTGVGGGWVVDRRVLEGPNRIAGEWGHNPLPSATADDLPLPACYCGRAGCIETYLAGPAMLAEHLQRHDRVGAGAGAPPQNVQEIVAGAAAGHGACLATLDRYCVRLARALAGVINLVDPDVIVLGGGLSGIEALYARVPALWSRDVFSDSVRTRLAPPAHGDASGVRGAAWLWEAS